MSSGDQKSKFEVSAGDFFLRAVQDPILGLQRTTFSLCLLTSSPFCVCLFLRLSISFYKDTSPIGLGPAP